MVTFLRIARVAGLVLAIAGTSGVIAAASSRALDSRSSIAPAPSFAPFANDLHTIVLVAGDRVRSVCDASNLPGVGFVEFDWAPLSEPGPETYCFP
jgi:hypothetical protein